MQRGSYRITARPGRDFASGFEPQLSPREMLRLGVFGGCYMTSCATEYPSSWFQHARLATAHDPSLNHFRVSAGQPLRVWRANGWIDPRDPRGWFEWFARYWLGRRCDDGYDARQIARWRNFGPRHLGTLRRASQQGRLVPVQRQALLQWSYDSRV